MEAERGSSDRSAGTRLLVRYEDDREAGVTGFQ